MAMALFCIVVAKTVKEKILRSWDYIEDHSYSTLVGKENELLIFFEVV